MSEQGAASRKAPFVKFGDLFRVDHRDAALLSRFIEAAWNGLDVRGIALAYLCPIEPRNRVDVSDLFNFFPLLLCHGLVLFSQFGQVLSREEMLSRLS